jgi:erythromycin esterase-like protein
VIPVGTRDRQQLVRIRRTSRDRFAREELEDVVFVPLIGAQGWQDIARSAPETTRSTLPEMIRAAAHDLPDPSAPAFAATFDRWGDRRVVLLGESTHGTSEFYRARAAITRRLVEHHGFDVVAAEADWPDALTIDREVRGLPPLPGAKPAFRRFPTWMWRNTDVKAFTGWLRQHNVQQPVDQRAGFYGLDIYSLSDSIDAVLAYLDRVDPEAARIARERYGCLTPWQQNPSVYGRSVTSGRYRECEEAVVATLTDLLKKRLEYSAQDGMQFFNAAQNARLVASAEKYYRACYYYGNAESWNLRDRHMFETLANLLEHRGPNSKAVVWAHNSHVGDARFTDMGRRRDELNIGQLCRERFGDKAALIGLGTHAGTVAAADHWDGEMQVMNVRPSREGSVERLFHDSELGRGVLAFDEAGDAREGLRDERLERFIGVIYRTETELMSHYAEVELTGQFDAYLWFDQTRAVTPT